MRNILWTPQAWEEYLQWQKEDKRVLKKINTLIKECIRSPFEGTGKPESLKNNLSKYWSRRITKEHRFVYRVYDDKIAIVQCRNHY